MEVQADDELLDSQELADYLKLPLSTVYVWQARGTGPDAIRVGRYTRYRMTAVRTWLDARSARPRQASA
jgi:predicted DNA-binding transcriptional regulator AlpA